jgi:pilus assembly protein CpaF
MRLEMMPCNFFFKTFRTPQSPEVCDRERNANSKSGKVTVEKTRNRAGATPLFRPSAAQVNRGSLPPDERILLIDDTAEIQLGHPNLVRFEARQPQNGLPAVTIRDLLKASLRHRPDRIVLGEIRGGEAFDLLQLLNTGHSGTLSTIHANSAKQGLSRFTSCVLQSWIELPYRAIKTNISDSLHVVVQIERRPGRRFVSEVLEIKGYDPEADLYDFDAAYLAKREPV